MPAYDATRFTPPAPLAKVTLRNPANGAALPDVPMLLDSGADVTVPVITGRTFLATRCSPQSSQLVWGTHC
jgi:hypothetical protein